MVFAAVHIFRYYVTARPIVSLPPATWILDDCSTCIYEYTQMSHTARSPLLPLPPIKLRYVARAKRAFSKKVDDSAFIVIACTK